MELDTKKIKEVTVDIRQARNHPYAPILMKRGKVDRVPIYEDLIWSLASSLIDKKAVQCLFFLMRVKKKTPVLQDAGKLSTTVTLRASSHTASQYGMATAQLQTIKSFRAWQKTFNKLLPFSYNYQLRTQSLFVW